MVKACADGNSIIADSAATAPNIGLNAGSLYSRFAIHGRRVRRSAFTPRDERVF
jgi:hypothetical protein